jgi:hypothetical protein
MPRLQVFHSRFELLSKFDGFGGGCGIEPALWGNPVTANK